MEKKWKYCAVYYIIQIHFVKGVWEKTVNTEENVYATLGSDVNLTCQTQTVGFFVQMQWSKVTNKIDLIAVYHPQYGFYCAYGRPCESLVTFTETPENGSKWTLHLRNMSCSVSGRYECMLVLYPEGIQTKIYNLLIQTHVTADEWNSNHTIEIEINQTLEIPCFQNSSSKISSEFTYAWSVENSSTDSWVLLSKGIKEDNGTQETLISQNHLISNSTLLKDRVKLGTDYRLHLSPVQIFDDGRKFSCHIRVGPNKILRSSTTVKVFAKPEIPVIVENNSTDVLVERRFTCLLKNVFPKANITWFIDGSFLHDEKEGIYITNEERKGKDGFLELKSVLTRVHSNKPAQSDNLTIWCMALSPVPGNKVWNISSEKITFLLGSEISSTDPPLSVTESTLDTQPSPASSVSPARYPATSSVTLVDVSALRPNTTPQPSNSSMTTRGFNYPWTSSGTDTKKFSRIPSETYSSSPSGAGSTLHDNVFTSTARAFSEVPTTANGSTKTNHVHITGIVVNKPKDGMSWPVIVAALLFCCMILFGLGVRKWCQYQKEIMERPPPFKPPPPPIKYTCIQEPNESDLPYHEMETL
ncbi:T-cell surface protein tactile isoform X1 [Homo sapiens]|uniref:T-cell surface protein tactile isoform X1 n=1 Tax=Homo sapiens TaxID=9606 RepID=UPI0003EB0449|nr:T-cell surface protein tactile isoform X1 [Homo sapiens]XP_054200883.1 T-cell surface protein tactile isoform X1 [Homo sapiens]|eukprot:XP_006713532.1 T-cell surface protein tactile isoform X1 [Homo sapiens]